MEEQYVKPWAAMKSRNVVEQLAKLIDQLSGNSNESECLDNLSRALYDATKLMAEFNNADWDPADRDIVVERGYAGFEELLVKYGMLKETTEEKKRNQIMAAVNEMRQLLEGNRAPNRTLIHEILGPLPDDPWIAMLKALTEQVSIDQLQWEGYQELAKDALKQIEESFEPILVGK